MQTQTYFGFSFFPKKKEWMLTLRNKNISSIHFFLHPCTPQKIIHKHYVGFWVKATKTGLSISYLEQSFLVLGSLPKTVIFWSGPFPVSSTTLLNPSINLLLKKKYRKYPHKSYLINVMKEHLSGFVPSENGGRICSPKMFHPMNLS